MDPPASNDIEQSTSSYPKDAPETTENLKIPNNAPGDDEDPGSIDIDDRVSKRAAKTGVAFLLSQEKTMRASSNVQKDLPQINANVDPPQVIQEISKLDKENESMPKDRVPTPEPMTKRPRIELTYKVLENGPNDDPVDLLLEPLVTIKDCFNSGTAPNFRFSRQIEENNYVRSCLWSRDGDWLVTDSEDRIARIFRFMDNELEIHKAIPSGDLIYDMIWHPHKNIFASTSKDQPIHLLNTDGIRIITFRGINDLDELSSAHSLSFSPDGKTLYAGYYKAIRIFDMEQPGRQVRSITTFKKGDVVGQKSIISCIAQNPIFHGVYAAASYGHSVGFYSETTGKLDSLINADYSGITQIQYSHDGNFLYCGCRRSNVIEVFDMRFPGQVLANLERPCDTNQRIYFQTDSCGRYLFTGSSMGRILVHNLSDMGSSLEPKKPDFSIPVSKTVVSGLSLHPTNPLISVTTGQRVFPMPISDSDMEESGDENQYVYSRRPTELDNCLRLFNL